MGTRCLTRVINDGKHILNLYRQFDGYPDGHGKELAEFINGKPIVNGYQSEDKKAFNGAGCMAASIVAHFKKDIGGFYINSTDATDLLQDYEYILTVDSKVLTLKIKVISRSKILFEGNAQQFSEWCNTPADEKSEME